MELVNPQLRFKSDQIKFILCKSCFWCASKLSGEALTKCPRCNKHLFRDLPISKNEKYTVTFDENNSINLKFT